jgi:peptidoglycan/LPS O-acetylase OafA/YrhL
MATATIGAPTPKYAPNRQRQVIGIDLIRFIASILVLNFHFGFWIWAGVGAEGGFNVSYHQLAPFTWFGWVGVEIFFVISGFVIAYSAHGVKALRFARNRVIRIYPTAWICASITFIAIVCSHAVSHHGMAWHDGIARWLRSICISPTGPWVDGSYWTLPIELSFYTLVFLLLATRMFRRLDIVMAAIGCASACINIVDWMTSRGMAFRGGSSMPWEQHELRTNLLLLHHGVYFAIGALLWLSVFQKKTLLRTVALIICMIGGVFEIMNESARIDQLDKHLALIPILLWLVALSAILLSVVKNRELTQALSPLGLKICRTLGLMTYPLYLVHQRVGYFLIREESHFMPFTACLILTEALMIAGSYFIVIWLEQPAQRLLKKVIPG